MVFADFACGWRMTICEVARFVFRENLCELTQAASDYSIYASILLGVPLLLELQRVRKIQKSVVSHSLGDMSRTEYGLSEEAAKDLEAIRMVRLRSGIFAGLVGVGGLVTVFVTLASVSPSLACSGIAYLVLCELLSGGAVSKVLFDVCEKYVLFDFRLQVVLALSSRLGSILFVVGVGFLVAAFALGRFPTCDPACSAQPFSASTTPAR